MSETTEHQIYACWCGHRPIRHPRRGDVIVCLECEAAVPTLSEVAWGELAQRLERAADNLLALHDLLQHGYIIVHPDDVRARDIAIIQATCDQLGVVVAYPMDNRGWFDAIIAAAERETP